MAKRRNYKAAHARRNARARAAGFRSYAEQRLAKGIAAGKSPEQARGRPKAQQKRVISKTAQTYLKKRETKPTKVLKPKPRGKRIAVLPFLEETSSGKIRQFWVQAISRMDRSHIGLYWSKLLRYLEGDRYSGFKQFHEDPIYDALTHRYYPFVKDLAKLEEFFAGDTSLFEDGLYRTITEAEAMAA